MRSSLGDPTYYAFLAGLSLLLLLVLASVVFRGWSATYRAAFPPRPPAWWTFSESAWKGWRRASGLLLIDGVFFVVGAWVAPLGQRHAIPLAIPLLFGGVTLLIAVLANLVIFFNVPKALVAPELRHEEGIAAEWWSRRKKNN